MLLVKHAICYGSADDTSVQGLYLSITLYEVLRGNVHKHIYNQALC